VRTQAKSSVRLQLLGQGYLDLGPESTVLMDHDGEGATRTLLVRLERGSARGATTATKEGATPIVIQSIDGSRARLRAAEDGKPMEFRLTGRDSGKTELAVLKGSARVANAQGEVVLQDGTAIDVDEKKPNEVVQLLAFPKSLRPGADARYQFAKGAKVRLEWAPVPQASSYVLEIARDLSFEDVLSSSTLTGTKHAFAPEDEGTYAWRVAARDAGGRQSEFGFARRFFTEKEIPRDLLLAPRDATRLAHGEGAQPRVTFSWQPVGDAKAYRLVIRKSGDTGGDPVLEKETTVPRLVVETLEDGAYTWGVYVIRGETESPIFLTLRTLAIRQQEAPRARTDGLWREPGK
jgi:hypothetical protein